MDTLQAAATILAALITGLLGKPAINHFMKRKQNGLLNSNEFENLIKYLTDEFKNGFVNHDIEENYFYVQTGIRTNYKSIKHYINLKDKLGKNFNWGIILSAKPYFRIEENGIIVKLNKLDRFNKNFKLIFGSILFLSVILISFLLINVKITSWSGLTLFFILYIIPILLGLIIINSASSLVDASTIKNRLNKIDNVEEKPEHNEQKEVE